MMKQEKFTMKSKRKKQNNSQNIVKNSILKIIVFSIIIGLNWTGILAVGKTLAYFSDTESSNANITVAALDFSVPSNPAPDFSPDITPVQNSFRTINLENNGNLDFEYEVRVEDVVGDLCGYLTLQDDLTGDVWLLNDFVSATTTFSEKLSWTFTAQLTNNNESLQNQTCNFNFVFDGWQPELCEPNSGFSDNEEIANVITSGVWSPEVTVIYPNGGEIWYLVPPGYAYPGFGQYELLWEAVSPIYDGLQLAIDIWFCKESGANCFHQIVSGTENDGSYWWTLPYESDFMTDEARIKVVATDPGGLTGEDMSDVDFCPPMLTMDDLADLEELMGLFINGNDNQGLFGEPVCENGANQPCGSQVGACQIGVQICEQGVWGKCLGAVMPTKEICDEIDNDCDNEVDENGVCDANPVIPDDTIIDEAVDEEETGQEAMAEQELFDEEELNNEELSEEEAVEEEILVDEEEIIEEIFDDIVVNKTTTDVVDDEDDEVFEDEAEPTEEDEPAEPTEDVVDGVNEEIAVEDKDAIMPDDIALADDDDDDNDNDDENLEGGSGESEADGNNNGNNNK